MKRELFGILVILSVLLINFVCADKLTISPITGYDIVSGINQPGASIVENNANNPTLPPAGTLQSFIKTNWIYLSLGIGFIIVILLVIIILKKQKRR